MDSDIVDLDSAPEVLSRIRKILESDPHAAHSIENDGMEATIEDLVNERRYIWNHLGKHAMQRNEIGDDQDYELLVAGIVQEIWRGKRCNAKDTEKGE